MRNLQTYRYMLDNLVTVITPAFRPFLGELVDASKTLQAQIYLALYTIFPIAAVMLLVCGAAVFLPVLRRVNKERSNAANLFCEIPRSTAVNTHSVCSAENEKLEERYKSSRVAVGKRGVRLSFVPLCCFCAHFLFRRAL